MEIYVSIKTSATVQKMHACKSGTMEKTCPIPRFEIIGRFNLTNVCRMLYHGGQPTSRR